MDYVLDYFKQGLFNADDLQLFAAIGWITADQYKQATGTDLPADK